MRLEPRHQMLLQELSSRVYEKYKDRLMKKDNPNKEVEFVLDKVLEEGDLTPEKRKQFELIKQSGYFSKEVEYADPEIEKLMSAEIDEGVKDLIAKGLIPKQDDSETKEASAEDTAISGE